MLSFKFISLFLILFKFSQCIEFVKEQPDYFNACYLSKPDVNQCATKQAQQIFEKISNGIPDVLTSIDPYTIKKVKFRLNNENISVKTIFQNITITGLKNIKVKSSKISSDGLEWEFEIYAPKIVVNALYDIDGRILLLQLKGKGPMWVQIEGLLYTVKRKLNFINHDGYNFVNFTDIKIDVKDIKKVQVNLGNLFDGNKELEKTTNDFFNDNWKDFFGVIKPFLIRGVENLVANSTQKFYEYIPAKFFYADVDSFYPLQ